MGVNGFTFPEGFNSEITVTHRQFVEAWRTCKIVSPSVLFLPKAQNVTPILQVGPPKDPITGYSMLLTVHWQSVPVEFSCGVILLP